jgi:hypothetical protein
MLEACAYFVVVEELRGVDPAILSLIKNSDGISTASTSYDDQAVVGLG